MSMLAVPIIAVFALLLSVFCIVLLWVISSQHKIKNAVVESQSQAHELLINNLQLEYEKLLININKQCKTQEQALLETVQVSKQLEHRIKTLQNSVSDQQTAIERLQAEQGEDKFYSRAIKLAKKGAQLEEIVSECELPHAEAEMLLSVYQTKLSS